MSSIKDDLQNLDDQNRTFEIEQVLGLIRADDTIRIQLDDGSDENALNLKMSMEEAERLQTNLRGTIE
jgi:hypothetical protein